MKLVRHTLKNELATARWKWAAMMVLENAALCWVLKEYGMDAFLLVAAIKTAATMRTFFSMWIDLLTGELKAPDQSDYEPEDGPPLVTLAKP